MGSSGSSGHLAAQADQKSKLHSWRVAFLFWDVYSFGPSSRIVLLSPWLAEHQLMSVSTKISTHAAAGPHLHPHNCDHHFVPVVTPYLQGCDKPTQLDEQVQQRKVLPSTPSQWQRQIGCNMIYQAKAINRAEDCICTGWTWHGCPVRPVSASGLVTYSTIIQRAFLRIISLLLLVKVRLVQVRDLSLLARTPWVILNAI